MYNGRKHKGVFMDSLLEGCDTSAKLRAFMAARRITQVELASLLKVTRETIINRLTDNRWDVKELEIIATRYGINKSDLI